MRVGFARPRYRITHLYIGIILPQRVDIASGKTAPGVGLCSGHLCTIPQGAEITRLNCVVVAATHHTLVKRITISGIIVEERHLGRTHAVIRRIGIGCSRRRTYNRSYRQ